MLRPIALIATAGLMLAALPASAALLYALSFDGVDDYVETSTAVIPSSGDFTVECWAYVGQLPAWGGIDILSQGTSGNAFYLGSLSGYLRLGDGATATSVLFPVGKWHHFAVVKSETNTIFYLDGTNVLSLGLAIPNPAATPFRLGRQYGEYGEYWPGKIGDVRVWNRALSATDVQADLLNQPTGTEPGLLSAWLFAEGAGTNCAAVGATPANGTLKNGPTWWSKKTGGRGQPGYALSFDGVDDWVDSGASIIPAQGDFTVECWASCPGSLARAPTYMEILSQGSVGNAFYIGTDALGNTIRLGDTWVSTGIRYPFDAWHHFAVVKSSDRTLFYLDGVVRATNGPIANPTGTTSFRLGRQYGEHGEYWQGQIDEVRVWSRALGEAEIRAGMDQMPLIDDTLEVCWPFREGPGSVRTPDVSGHGHSGWLMNRTQWVPAGRPALLLNGADPLTNECHTAFVDPGAVASVLPVGIAAGDSHILALKADGTVVGWGWNACGQCNVPAGLANVVSIAAGSDHSLALKADGTVVAWGDNSYDQCQVPPRVNNVVAIAAGPYHNLALKTDGTVVAWGNDWRSLCQVPAGLSNVVAIAAGYYHSLALKSDGTVAGWGDPTSTQWQVPDGLSNVVAIAAGLGHSLALKTDGTVVGWGDNSDGQCSVPAWLADVVAVAGGAWHSLALRADGTVVGWGYDDCGETQAWRAGESLVAIAAGQQYGVALRADGTIVGWGDPHDGKLSAPANASYDIPATVHGTVNTAATGVYPLTYGFSNNFCEVLLATRNVVVVDTLPPVVALNGDNPLAVAVGAEWHDPGAVALDACAGDVTGNIQVSGEVNMNQPGSYTLHYAAADSSGNVSFTNRTVVVAQEGAPPAIFALSAACVSTNDAIGTLGVKFHASVNPSGSPATVVFQYGRTISYPGNAARVDLPTSLAYSNLTASLDGLIPGIAYHWRVVASNAFGVSFSPDQELRVGTPIVGTGLPGDLNGDGVVQKGEVEAAMFSYLFSAAPTLTMTNLIGMGQGRVVFTVPELPGATLRTLVSTNLEDWENLGPAVPSYEFTDTNAPAGPKRFYRVSWP